MSSTAGGGNSSSSSGSSSSGLASLSLDNIYRCLNRCILFLLSRPADLISEQMSLLKALHKLTNRKYVNLTFKMNSNLFLYYFWFTSRSHLFLAISKLNLLICLIILN
jgi:hypothetical protein